MSNEVYRRDFARGFVVLNPPGNPARQLSLDGIYRDLNGQLRLGSITLPGGAADVLIKVL